MADVEDIVKWVVSMQGEGPQVTESLAYISHTTVDPNSNRLFVEDPIASDAEAKKLVELAVSKLGLTDSCSMETLKMQIAYHSTCVQQETYHQHFQSVQTKKPTLTSTKSSTAKPEVARTSRASLFSITYLLLPLIQKQAGRA